MKWSRYLGLLLFMLLSGSCKSANIVHLEQPEVLFPETWSHPEHKESTVVQPWLKDFNDPELDQIIDKALKNNFDLKAVAARMEAAFATIKRSGADMLPQADLQFNQSNSKGFGSKNSTDLSKLNLKINWELDIWGKLRALKEADVEEFKASQADFKAAQLSLAVNVAKLWFSAIEKREQIALAAKRFESFKKNLSIIDDGYEQGILSELDIRLTRSDVARAENRMVEEKELYDRTIRALQILLGQYPLSDLQVPDTLVQIKKSVPAGLPSQLLLRRPDIIAAEHRLIESGKRFKVAKKNKLPDFSLTGQAGVSSAKLMNLLNINNLLVTIAGQLSQPLFAGGRLTAEREIALARSNERLAQYSQAILTAFQEVETTLARESYLIRQEQLLDEAQTESLRAENLAMDLYFEGLNDIIVYLEAQRRTYDAQRSLIQVINQRVQNRLDLYLALGGEFKPEPITK